VNPILCPVRNGLHLTREAVRTFLAQDIGDVEVLLIDNDSQDGTAQWLWSQPVQAVHFRPGKSVAASWNFGLSHLFGKGAEYVLVVNNDVELRPDTMRHLVADGGLFVTAVGTRDRQKIAEPYAVPSEHKRPHPDFSCFLIRRAAWELVGPFNESYVGAYCEDADYHLRLHRAGVHAECLDLAFLHYGAQTLVNADKVEAAAIRANADHNRALFLERNGVAVGSAEYYALFGHVAPSVEAVEEAPSHALSNPTETSS